MTRTPLVLTSALCIAAIAGCHRYQTPAPNERVVETTTTTTTTTTSGGDITPSPNRDSTVTTTYRDSTAMHVRHTAAGGANVERRELHMAIHSLTRARAELEGAKHDFGGRRTDALRAVDDALREVRLALGQETGPYANAPREERRERNELHAAVQSLERARADMEHATHNFGGRRTEVLRAVDNALRELRLAQQYES